MSNEHSYMLCFIILSIYVLKFTHGLCDQRQYGGGIKCCPKKDSNCFVKVHSKRGRGQTSSICYCDSHCKLTNDCCDDYEKVKELCKGIDCKVSSWQVWGQCIAECGFGTMKRKRKIIQYPKNNGKACPNLQQKRACNTNKICTKQKSKRAFILPITFRRPKFGKWLYEDILPAKKTFKNIKKRQFKRKSRHSYCINYRITYKKNNCKNTWAAELSPTKFVCTECQVRAMKRGHCRGEGIVGKKSEWEALGTKGCKGEWIRLGPIIPNCSCVEERFSNHVFV